MKKILLPASILLLSISLGAQTMHIDNAAAMKVEQKALLYIGGTTQTKGSGVANVNGNVMIAGTSGNAFKTLAADGTTPKTDGQNFRLLINDPTVASPVSYGQLYITGLRQAEITGIVDKEYKNPLHGSFQQMAVPFSNKSVSSFATEMGRSGNFTNTRTTNALGFWDNEKTVMRVVNPTGVTTQADINGGNLYGPTTYFAVGTAGINTTFGSVKTFKGQPFADGADVIVTLQNGGAPGGVPINYGTAGQNRNEFNETFRSYIIDPFTTPQWSSSYGKELYQLGNPFLTNIDLSKIGTESSAQEGSVTDLNKLPVQGIRYNASNITFNQGTGTSTGSNLTLTFTGTTDRIPAGDINNMILKPLGVFYIKLDPTLVGTNGYTRTLNFNNLRRFNGTARAAGTAYSVNAARSASQGTVKQLGVIGLNAQGKEVGRTYYVVYPNATTGFTTGYHAQANTGFTGISSTPVALPLETKEESPAGGMDATYADIYSLYINEANENDFKHKEIPLKVNSSEITQLKFEIRENAELVSDNQSVLSAGEAFWIRMNGQNIQLANNMTIPATGVTAAGLYYGEPQTAALGTADTNIYTGTVVVYQPTSNDYVVLFSKKWKKANIQIFDMSGRLINSAHNVDATKSYTLNIPKEAKTGYVVKIVSAEGEVVTTKIMR